MPSPRGKKRVDVDAGVYAEAAAAAEQLHVSTAWLITQFVREGLAVKRGGAWHMQLLGRNSVLAPAPAPVDDGMEEASTPAAPRPGGTVPGFRTPPKRRNKR